MRPATSRTVIDNPVQKLPLWRLITGLSVFAALIAVLLSLAPVYLENLRLQQSFRNIVQATGASDQTLRDQAFSRARELGLPVTADQIQVTHPGGKAHMEAKYAVQMNFRLYQVDVHFKPSASAQ